MTHSCAPTRKTRILGFFTLTVVFLGAMGGMFVTAVPAHAATSFTAGDLKYATNDDAPGTVTMIGRVDPSQPIRSVSIGASVSDGQNTYSITAIGNRSFENAGVRNLDLNGATNLTTIGDSAFYGNQITQVTIPDSVTTFANAAFSSNQLTQVTIPNSVTTISDSAFSLNQLTQVTIPNSVTTIGNSAFSLNQLTQVTIPNSVTTIGNSAFSLNQLTQVTIPNSVTTIGNSAFLDNQLTQVTIPDSVTTISSYVFASNQLAQVTIPDSVTTIGDFAFNDNHLTEVTIPSSVATIGSGVFYDNHLTEVTIPSSVATIGSAAFYSNRLTVVTISDGVTSIGDVAFYANPLVSVVFLGSAPSTFTGKGPSGSLGENDVTVYYPKKAGSAGDGSFTPNTWHGYPSRQFPELNYNSNAQDTSGVTATTDPDTAPTSFTDGVPSWEVSVAKNEFTRPGYSFTGWDTQADGKGSRYQPGASIELTTQDTTLYATWKANPTPPSEGGTTGGGPQTPAVPQGTDDPWTSPFLSHGELPWTGTSHTLGLAALVALLLTGAGALLTHRHPKTNP